MPCMQDVPLRGRRRVITSARIRKAVPLFAQAFVALASVVQAFASVVQAFAALASALPSFDRPSFVPVAS